MFTGSPFHPKIVDPRKLRVIGGWENIVDANNNFLQLVTGQVKRIEFDTSLAGPGNNNVTISIMTNT